MRYTPSQRSALPKNEAETDFSQLKRMQRATAASGIFFSEVKSWRPTFANFGIPSTTICSEIEFPKSLLIHFLKRRITTSLRGLIVDSIWFKQYVHRFAVRRMREIC